MSIYKQRKNQNIKPCPFCRGEARTRTTRKMNTDKDTRYYVECKECYSSSNPWYDMGAKDTKNEAITAWNTRDDSVLNVVRDGRKAAEDRCEALFKEYAPYKAKSILFDEMAGALEDTKSALFEHTCRCCEDEELGCNTCVVGMATDKAKAVLDKVNQQTNLI